MAMYLVKYGFVTTCGSITGHQSVSLNLQSGSESEAMVILKQKIGETWRNQRSWVEPVILSIQRI